MNAHVVMEFIGVLAALSATVFFLFGRHRRMSRLGRSLFAVLMGMVLVNATIDIVEQTGAYRQLDLLEDYVDTLLLLAWGIFIFALSLEFSTKGRGDNQRHRDFTRQLIFVFAWLLLLNVVYSLSSFMRSRDTLTNLRNHHGPTLVSVVHLQSRSNNAIQEAFAYVISGETVEKDEFETWARSFQAEAREMRSLGKFDELHASDALASLDAMIQSQATLVDDARKMFSEFEATGNVSLETFHKYEAVVDTFGQQLESLRQAEQASYDQAQAIASETLEDANVALPILGSMSVVLCGTMFLLLAWSFRQYSDEQELARRELAEKEERHRAFLDNLPDLIWVADTDKRCTFFNKTWLDFTGRPLDQELGHGWAEGVHTDDFDRALSIYETAFDAREPFSMEYRLRRSDGEYRWILDVGTPWFERNDQFAGYINGCIDITQRRQATENLRRRDEAFRTAATPISFADLDGRITEANQALAELFGFESVEPLIGTLNTRFHSEPISVEEINAAIIETGGFEGEITTKRLDGTPLELRISATLFKDDSGIPVGSMAACEDITPRRQAERALVESEQHYRTLVETAPEAIVVLDVDEFKFTDVNESATRLFGLDRAELLQTGPFGLSPQKQPDGRDSAEAAMGFIQLVLNGEAPAFEWLHRDSHGNDIQCEVRLSRMASDRRLVRGSITDIRARIELKNALSRRAQEAELLYQAVAMADETDSFDEALKRCIEIVCEMTGWPVGHAYVPSSDNTQRLDSTTIWHFSDEQQFANFRDVTERTTFMMGEGLPGRIWLSSKPAWIENVQEDDNFSRNKVCDDLGVKAGFGFPVKANGETVAILEFYHERVAEKNETLLLLVRSVGEQVGRVIERQTAQEASRRQHELVATELEKAKVELVIRTRLAAVGQMSAQIAHEMRNPLGAVSNAVYYLKRHVPETEKRWSDYLQLIDGEIATCNRFIGDLLDVTRSKSPDRSMADLADLIARVVARHEIPDSIEFQVVCQPQPFEIYADRDQMVQVLDNLLRNALDAVGDDAGRIEIRAHCDGETDILSVRDSGRGISRQDRASIFDVLFTTKPAGTGLGLPICKQIIEKHGGTIELVDDDSPGSNFLIRLPAMASCQSP